MTTIKANEAFRSVLVLLAAAALGVSGAALTGCNTVEGAGEDVEAVGEGVSGAADETQEEIFE